MNRTTVALNAVNSASRFLVQQFRNVREGVKKKDGTFISSADIGAEHILLSAIKKSFPGDGILSEESQEIQSKSGYRWLIDPLDGTHNFLSGLPLFGCLLALECNGKIIYSICSFPVLNEVFVAEKGKGVLYNGKKVDKVQSSEIFEGICSLDGNRNLPLSLIFSDIEKCVKAGFRWRMFGSCAYSLACVARGEVKIALGHLLKPWDIAAPAFLVEEAGGKVTDISGKQWGFDSEAIIASNGFFHKKAINILTKLI